MKVLCISFLLIVASNSYSQTLKPEFSFTLYAEDAKGNRDSVILGYHPDARQDEVLDTRFADLDISDKPFDSIFEIRAHKIFWLWTKGIQNPPFLNKGMSKHLTLTHNSEKCFDPYQFGYGRNMGFILVKIKYPPLKLSWDKTLFSKILHPCINQSFLFYSDYPMYFMFNHELLKKVTYLKEVSEIPESQLIPVKFKNNLGLIDSFQTNYVISFEKSSMTTSTYETAYTSLQHVFPNPCNYELNIILPEPFENCDVTILDPIGAILNPEYGHSQYQITINTKPLKAGSYFISVRTKGGKRYIAKFLKID